MLCFVEGKNIAPRQFQTLSKQGQQTDCRPPETINRHYDWDGKTIMERLRTKQSYSGGAAIVVENSSINPQRLAPDRPTVQ